MSKSGLILAKILLDYWQRKYAYHLLILPDRHPTKDILLITLRVGNRSVQSGELLEKDEI